MADRDRVPVRPDLRDVEAYGAPQLDVPVRLNTNETAEPPPGEFLDAVRDRLGRFDLNRYPDRDCVELRSRLADEAGLDARRVWVANGSNEILHQLLLAYGGPDRRVLLFRPGYSMYPLLARVTLTPTVEHDLDAELRLAPDIAADAVERHDADVVLIAHPNNPTGIPVAHESIRALHDAGRALVVVDEAYIEFGGDSARSLLNDLPRLVVSRTFSKAYRLAGLRLGYLLAHDWVVDDLLKVRLPYHVDTLKQVAALAALDVGAAMLTHIPDVAEERARVMEALEDMQGVDPVPSVANFVLFRSSIPDLFDRLLGEGVLVRDFSTKPRLEGCLRVTIGTRAENDAFLAALRGLA